MNRAAAAAIALLAVPAAWSQMVISARSGLIHYVEGNVTMAGDPVVVKIDRFPEVREGETLVTEQGRAEILLTPGVFLRLGLNASVKMISSQLIDTKIELLTGSALIEAEEILIDNRITVKMGDSETVLLKQGLYRFDADAGQVRVFDGKAQVSTGSDVVVLTKGREIELDSAATPEKFRIKDARDALYAWSSQRANVLAQANTYAARKAGRDTFQTSTWAYDPWFGMFTFFPRSGLINGPFGFTWYSPSTMQAVSQTYQSGSQSIAGTASAAPSSGSASSSSGPVWTPSSGGTTAAPSTGGGVWRGR